MEKISITYMHKEEPFDEVGFYKGLKKALVSLPNMNLKGASEKNVWLKASEAAKNYIIKYCQDMEIPNPESAAEKAVGCKAIEVAGKPEKAEWAGKLKTYPDLSIIFNHKRYAVEYVKVATMHDFYRAYGQGLVHSTHHDRTLVILCDKSSYLTFSKAWKKDKKSDEMKKLETLLYDNYIQCELLNVKPIEESEDLVITIDESQI